MACEHAGCLLQGTKAGGGGESPWHREGALASPTLHEASDGAGPPRVRGCILEASPRQVTLGERRERHNRWRRGLNGCSCPEK